jgi:hypothetical protein
MSGRKAGRNDGTDVIRAVDYLRKIHPVKTGLSVEAETGISSDTFRKWCDGAGRPSFSHYTTLIRIYGMPFLRAVMGASSPKWLDAAYADAENDRIEKQILELRERQRELRA